ncbi:MAG: hypothetical protein ACRC6F_06120 [Aeromonas sp.]
MVSGERTHELIKQCSINGTQKIPASKVIRLIYHELIVLKEAGLTWAGILKIINENDSNFNVSAKTLERNILRIRKDLPPKISKPVEQVMAVEQDEQTKRDEQNRAKEKIRQDRLDAIDVSREFMDACFYKKVLAVRCMENDVSIEMIKSWGCGNFVQLSNQLSNYLMHKKSSK